MYTKNDLKSDLQKMGLLPRDSILVHSSMKSIGEVEGRADTVLDAFMEYFSDGLFMMPTHTWGTVKDNEVYDYETSPCNVGILPELFRQRKGVVRSLHPSHSIAAYGKAAEEYIKHDEDARTPCPPDGCFGRLRDIDAKILLLGVGHNRNTYIHSVEETLALENRLTNLRNVGVKLRDGSVKQIKIKRHYCTKASDVSATFPKLTDAFEALGAAKRVKFGDADCFLCEARKIYDVSVKIFSIEPDCTLDRDTIPEAWWKE